MIIDAMEGFLSRREPAAGVMMSDPGLDWNVPSTSPRGTGEGVALVMPGDLQG